MHPLDENPAVNREPNQLPGFLFPSQMATLMLVKTEDLMPLTAPIVWPIFGAVMALRYPTQVLRVAANTPTLSILPMPMEFHPIAWLHIPLNTVTGAADSFTDWNVEVILRILATIIQRLGSRKRGESPSELRYPYVCDTSRMYCDRTSPRAHSARILNATTCWSKPNLVDLAVHQTSQRIKAKTPSMAKEPNRKDLPINTDVPSNPRTALEIFLSLHSRQKERGDSVGEDYARGIHIFKNLFVQYGHPGLANSLPDFS